MAYRDSGAALEKKLSNSVTSYDQISEGIASLIV